MRFRHKENRARPAEKRDVIVHVECASAYGGSVRCLEHFLAARPHGAYRHVVCLYTWLPATGVLAALSDDVWLAPPPARRGAGVRGAVRYLADQLWSIAWFYVRLRKGAVALIRLNNGPNTHVTAVLAARLARVPCVAWLRSFPRSRATRRWRLAMALPTHLVAVSEAVRRAHVAAGVPADRIVTMYDGTALSRHVDWKPRRGGPRQFRVGTLGRLVRWKGLTDFVRAAALVCRQHADVAFVIAGEEDPDDAGFRAELLREVKRLGVEGTVKLTGFCAEPASYLGSLDCLVQPSEVPEPFGMSILEAMAVSCPVIATTGGGAEEIIEHGVSGLLVPLRDPDGLARAIARLIEDRALADKLRDGGRVRVRNRFHLETQVASQYACLASYARKGWEERGGHVAAR